MKNLNDNNKKKMNKCNKHKILRKKILKISFIENNDSNNKMKKNIKQNKEVEQGKKKKENGVGGLQLRDPCMHDTCRACMDHSV